MQFRVVIPARYGASRLPGKPLLEIAGQPMIYHVHQRALESGAAEVIVATDNAMIAEVAEGFGASVCMTGQEHASGTDRIAEVADRFAWADDDVVVNLQGDEPQMVPALLRQVAGNLASRPEAGVATLCARIAEDRELFDPHVVKVVRDHAGYALYFSRAPIPWHREKFMAQGAALAAEGDFYRHLGLYAYRVRALTALAAIPPCELERTESLEQLRGLWFGVRIHVDEALEVPPVGVDTEEDLIRVNAAMVDDI